MEVVIGKRHPDTGNFSILDRNRSGPWHYYANLLESDPRMRGRVLDIGCGPDLPPADPVRQVMARCAQLDGVDPDPRIMEHPHLECRWSSFFETADIPEGVYDAAQSFCVVEHIRRARPFFEKLSRLLKPGGVFYAYTPHAVHPFAVLSRTIQMIGLKQFWSKHSPSRINEYPAYYCLNRLGSITRAMRGLDFERVEFHYIPSVQWDTYFPKPFKFVPHLYDRIVGLHMKRAALLLVYRIEKKNTSDSIT